MSEEERERLKSKEQRKNPVGTLNNAWAQAHTGAPSSGCLVNRFDFNYCGNHSAGKSAKLTCCLRC